jgi:hypothetical protein
MPRAWRSASKAASAAAHVPSAAVSVFFVNTEDGRVATRAQLEQADLVDGTGRPTAPWHPIRGPSDASTMWYAVLRKRERGVFIGTLCFRHSERRPLLESRGWTEVEVDAIGV